MPEGIADRLWLRDRAEKVEPAFMRLMEIAYFTAHVRKMTDFYWGHSGYLWDLDGHSIEIMRLEK
jgi:hypothetical protein